MSRIISIHSFRGGTGKSNTTANIAAALAMKGKRIAVVDTDLNSPGIHMLFNFDLEDPDLGFVLNHFLWGDCEIQEAAHDVTANLGPNISGQVYLLPGSIKTAEISRLLREGYDVGLLNDGFDDLIEALKLDVLLVDTHPGLSNETLLSIAITDTLLITLRPDYQDYQGTAVTVEVARKLQVPDMRLIINKMPDVYDFNQVRELVQSKYRCAVAAILPHTDEMMTLASQDIFVLRYPDHRISQEIKALVDTFL
ncbi:MAG: MinD/ParA family protein [Anaerolineae bacterium]|nr:MinD/ParA family protein [Anaerolineae bacterium]